MYKHVCASSAGRGRRVQATSLRQTARTGPASAEIKPSYRKEQISLGRFGFSQLLFSARLPILGVLLQAVGTVPPSITYSVPVMEAARGETRNAMRSATSSEILCCCIKISLQLVTDDMRSYGAAVGAESGRKASLPALTFSVKSR